MIVKMQYYDITMVKTRQYDTKIVKSRQYYSENIILYRIIVIVLSRFHHRSFVIRVIIIALTSIAFQTNTFKGDGPHCVP